MSNDRKYKYYYNSVFEEVHCEVNTLCFYYALSSHIKLETKIK